MAQKIDRQSEGESSSKKETKEVEQSKLGREAASATDHLQKLFDQQKHLDKSSSLSGVDMAQGDGSQLKVNAKGQATQVITAAGEVTQYKYGSDGKPNEITDKTGTWQKGGDGVWHCTSDPSKPDKHADITVDKRGICHEKHGDGETVHLTNGTTMERDKQNRVTEIVSASGDSQQFKYDANGKIIQFKDSREGTTWTSSNGWYWNSEKGARWEGGVAVNPKDGSYSRSDGYSRETTTYHGDRSYDVADGKTGAQRHYSADGHLQSVDITRSEPHRKFEFEYFQPPGSGLKAVHEPSGSVFRTTDGKHWTDQNGNSFTGSITAEADGTVRYCDQKNNVSRVNPDGTLTRRLANGQVIAIDGKGSETEIHPPINGQAVVELSQCAQDINKALKENKPEAIPELLKNKTAAERQEITQLYKRLFQHDLDSDIQDPSRGVKEADARDRALGYLRRPDGETPEADRLSKEAVYLHSQLSLLHQHAGDKDAQKLAEEQLRSSLSTMNSEQIAELKKQYRDIYKTDLIADISGDKGLSTFGKQALLLYSHGIDKRTDGDFMKLAEIAMRSQNLQMFQEVFSQTQNGQRDLFIKQGGEQRVKDAFGASLLDRLGSTAGFVGIAGLLTNPRLESARGGADALDTRANIALDYLHYGKRSVPTEIRESIKAITTDESNVNHVISNMTQAERDMYKAGRALSATPPEQAHLPPKVTAEQAKHFYQETHDALEDAARKWWEVKGITPDQLKVSQWEEAIMFPGSGFLRQLDSNRGLFGSQNVENFAREVEKMNPADRLAMARDPEYRNFVYGRLKELYPDEREYKRAVDVLQQGGRQVNDRIDNAIGSAEVISALAHLRPDSLQDLSKRNIDWDNLCDKVNERLRSGSKGDQVVAEWLLSRAREGKLPNPELADAYTKALSGQLNDPRLALKAFENLRNTTAGYQEMPANVKAAFDQAFLSRFDEKQRQYLEAHGHLPVADRVKLYCQGILGGDDKKALFQDLLSYPPEDRKALAGNEDLKRVFSKEQIDALTRSLNQPDANQKLERYAQLLGIPPDKKMVDGLLSQLNAQQRADIEDKANKLEHAPDQMRAFVLGLGEKSKVEDLLKQLPDAQRERLERDYAVKYGSSLSTDLTKLGQPDGTDLSRLLSNRGGNDWLHNAIADHDRSNNLLGRLATDTFSQSALETEEQRAKLQAKLAEAGRHFRQLPPEEQAKVVDSIAQALERYKKDKATAADVASSITIATIAIAGSVPTGGMSLLAVASLGGVLNPLARAAILGKDYDSKQLAQDIVAGIIGGGVAGLGPGNVVKLMPFGKMVASEAAEGTAASLGLTGAAKETLVRESAQLAQDALREGGDITAHELENLADKIIRTPGSPQSLTRDQLVAELKREYQKAIEEGLKAELKNPVIKVLTSKVTLNAAAAGAGGFAQGTASGAMQWNPEKGIYENVSGAIAQGSKAAWKSAAGAALGTAMLSGLGHLGKKLHVSEETSERTEIELGESAGVASAKVASRVGKISNVVETGAANAPGALPSPGDTQTYQDPSEATDDGTDKHKQKTSNGDAGRHNAGKKAGGKDRSENAYHPLPHVDL
jgi:YD repeat-containing protein